MRIILTPWAAHKKARDKARARHGEGISSEEQHGRDYQDYQNVRARGETRLLFHRLSFSVDPTGVLASARGLPCSSIG